eukprot:PhF_6_TR26709/c0_g1_i1/m.39047
MHQNYCLRFCHPQRFISARSMEHARLCHSRIRNFFNYFGKSETERFEIISSVAAIEVHQQIIRDEDFSERVAKLHETLGWCHLRVPSHLSRFRHYGSAIL